MIAIAVIVVGALSIGRTVIRTDRALRERLLQQTRLIVQSLDVTRVLGLSGTAADLESNHYLELKAQLARMRTATERCRFIYIVGFRSAPPESTANEPSGEHVFFFVDSEPPESEDYSPPGQVFEEVSDEFLNVFRTDAEYVEGPSTDRWGTWVSALIPLHDPLSGEVVAVVGVDVDARTWRLTVLAAVIWSAAITLAVLALMTLSISLARSRRRILSNQDALRESEERFRQIVEQSTDTFYRQNLGTARFEYVSPKIASLLGYTPEEMVAMSAEDQNAAVHPDDMPGLVGFADHVIEADARGEKRIEREFRLRNKQGEYRFVHGNYSLLRDPEGSPFLIIGSLHDVTERKMMEAEHLRLSVQLQQAQKMESVGRLAGGIAHDFNNLLMAILGYAELGQGMLSPDDPLRKNLEEITSAGRRAAELTRQLLAFAREQTSEPKVLDINAAIAAMLKSPGRLSCGDAELCWTPGEDIWPVLLDPEQLDNILMNLTRNAIDAMKGRGRIEIGTANVSVGPDDGLAESHGVSGDFVCLWISDDGSGMDRATLGHIFDPFFTTRKPGEGSGLGLSMVYGVVTQNGGFIDAESEPGKGSTFRIHFPRYGTGFRSQSIQHVD
jgi:PAS domain S-box-containing protein